MKFLQNLILCVLVLLLCTACVQKNGQNAAKKIKESKKKELLLNTLFIFGENFYTQHDIFQHIKMVYSEDSCRSRIHVLPYSSITAKTQQARTALLADYVEQYAITIIISFGLPEGYAHSLIAVKEKNPFLLIMTLAPMEDHLLLESCSNVVIECTFTDTVEKLDWDSNEHDSHILLLIALITAQNWHSLEEKPPIEQFTIGINTTKQILCEFESEVMVPAYAVIPFYDPEFNIPSYTHFILSRNTDDPTTANQQEHRL